ncbi:MAG: hypothetical protein PHI85_02750 [Victivallaceae bacterium]|nr:hypothetical protein [Victivallaceae bacterium]
MEHFKWLVYIVIAGLAAAAVWFFAVRCDGCAAPAGTEGEAVRAAVESAVMETTGNPAPVSEVQP